MPFQAIPVPLYEDENGGLRVIGTRVLLERILYAFENGATPETIIQSFDTLQLDDVYTVVSWYLRNKKEAEDYLRNRQEIADAFRQKVEATQSNRMELRTRLMKGKKKEVDNASPSQ